MHLHNTGFPRQHTGPRGVLAVLFVAASLLSISKVTGADPANAACLPAETEKKFITSDTLDVLTLNVAHGRGRAMNQMFVTDDRHRSNLDDVAELLTRTDAHVIALQEADAESLWSGGFDHVNYLASATGHTCFVHGHHADTWLSTYGTALMSKFAMRDSVSHTFRPSPPTMTKGFVRGTVFWHDGNDAELVRSVTLISVHLDFSRRKVRESQIAEMVEVLGGLSTPVVILGDFNADWTADDSPVREVAREFGLRAYSPMAEKLGTYGNIKRLDWILISEELKFIEYVVVPGLVSDHLALLAKIGWSGDH